VPLRRWIGTPIVALLLATLARPASLSAQLATTAVAPPAEPAARSYDALFDELMRMAPRADRVAEVSSLTLQRDVARFTLQSGQIQLLTPVGGRTVAAVFWGKGVFSFAPATTVERERLRRLEKADSLAAPFGELLLVFADGTLEELDAAVKFAPGADAGVSRGVVKQGLELLTDEDSRTFEPDLMSAFLNGERSELFYAHMKRSKVSRGGYSRRSEVVTQFPLRGRPRDGRIKRERLRQADIESYAIDVSLPPTGIGEIGFSASATMRIVADTAVGPWVAFELFEKLRVDSASWEGGEKATVVRGKDSPLLWVLLDRQIRPGDARTLRLHYHGDLIDRFVDFFRIKSSAAWYPRSLEGRSLAKFDLIFTTGSSYLLASFWRLGGGWSAPPSRLHVAPTGRQYVRQTPAPQRASLGRPPAQQPDPRDRTPCPAS
jgi:hypothetical protein